MAGGIGDALKRAKAKRKERTKKVSATFGVSVDGKARQVEFTGTQRTSRGGRRTVERLSSPFGTITTRKRVTKGTESLKIKKRFAKF